MRGPDHGAADMRRADDAGQGGPYDDQRAQRATWDSFDQMGAPNFERLMDGEAY